MPGDQISSRSDAMAALHERLAAAEADIRDDRYQLPAAVVGEIARLFAAGATVTVHTGTGTNTATDLYWGLDSSVWNNDGDTATVKRPDGTVISSLTRP